MKIKSVRIEGLFNEYDYEIAFNDGLSFIHAPNGCGKSVIMHMLYSLLNGDLDYISDVPFTRMDVKFNDETSIILQNNGGKLLLLVQKNELENVITAEELEDVANVIFLPPERLTVKKKDGHIVNAMESCAQELAELIRNVKENSELVIPEEERKNMSDSELEFWAKDLKANLDFIKDAGFEPHFPKGCRFPPSRFELIDNRKSNEDVIFAVAEYVKRIYPIAESIIVFKDIINSILINKNIEISETGKLIVKMDNGTVLPLGKLSSGENHLIILFYTILFHSHVDGIVLIDEPEVSLHITWQQMLGDYFEDICRVRNIQMIVATHSPQVIHNKWDLATELRNKNA